MRQTLKLLVAMLAWTAVTFAVVPWLNTLNLGSNNAHIAVNLVVWLGGYVVIGYIVTKHSKPEDRVIAPDSRLRAMAWVLALLGVALAFVGWGLTMGRPLAALARDPSLRSKLVVFVTAALFGVAALVSALLAFRVSGDRTARSYVRLSRSLNVLVVLNLLFALAVTWDGWVIAASTVLVTVRLRGPLCQVAREVVEGR